MKLDDLTVGEVKDLIRMFGQQHVLPAPDIQSWEIGEIYLIRTVTMIDTGRVVGITNQEIILEDAAWIADTGRFADAIKKAEFNEVEPFPDGRVLIGRGAVIDAVKIKKSPRSQK